MGSGQDRASPRSSCWPSAVIALFTWVNSRGIRTGALVQNVFTFAKTAALLCLIGFGFLLGRNPASRFRKLPRLLAKRRVGDSILSA